jgi:hypothetical protein
MPHSYVFPNSQEEHDAETSHHEHDSDNQVGTLLVPTFLFSSFTELLNCFGQDSDGMECNCGESGNGEPIWVEGLVPAIDFCNHG